MHVSCAEKPHSLKKRHPSALELLSRAFDTDTLPVLLNSFIPP